MSAVFSVRYVTLRPKTNPAEFEAFITSTCPTLPTFPEMNWSILKGDRGDREKQFAILYSYADVEIRNRLGSHEEIAATEALSYLASLADFLAKIDEYGSSFGELVLYTSYSVIAEF